MPFIGVTCGRAPQIEGGALNGRALTNLLIQRRIRTGQGDELCRI